MLHVNERDRAWLDALRRFLGDGSHLASVPFWRNPDNSVDAKKTVEAVFAMYDIKPKENAEP